MRRKHGYSTRDLELSLMVRVMYHLHVSINEVRYAIFSLLRTQIGFLLGSWWMRYPVQQEPDYRSVGSYPDNVMREIVSSAYGVVPLADHHDAPTNSPLFSFIPK